MHRLVRMFLVLCAGAAGAGLALLVATAVAKTFTLGIARDAKVTNFQSSSPHVTKFEPIVTALGGSAVYTLSGDSKRHPECTKSNGCFGFWPPVTLGHGKRATEAPGIKGKLSTWKRDGFTQLVLAGHPLYFFSGDGKKKRRATGEGIRSFGGVWHVVMPAGASSAAGSATGSGTTATAPYPPATTPTGTTTTGTTTTGTTTGPYWP